eukprot:425275-Pyramimonas_sp.AAC.1
MSAPNLVNEARLGGELGQAPGPGAHVGELRAQGLTPQLLMVNLREPRGGISTAEWVTFRIDASTFRKSGAISGSNSFKTGPSGQSQRSAASEIQ